MIVPNVYESIGANRELNRRGYGCALLPLATFLIIALLIRTQSGPLGGKELLAGLMFAAIASLPGIYMIGFKSGFRLDRQASAAVVWRGWFQFAPVKTVPLSHFDAVMVEKGKIRGEGSYRQYEFWLTLRGNPLDLRLGNYGTQEKAMNIAQEVSEFLELPLAPPAGV